MEDNIRKATPEDAAGIAEIYNYYVEHTTITFEYAPVSVAEMRDRIAALSAKYPYFVCESEGKIAGYCHASQWKKKEAYCQTVESTVYIAPSLHGKGMGKALMRKLMEALTEKNFHAIIACITIPNEKSVSLHEKLGFRQVSAFSEVGYKFDRWLDVGDWEFVLNRTDSDESETYSSNIKIS